MKSRFLWIAIGCRPIKYDQVSYADFVMLSSVTTPYREPLSSSKKETIFQFPTATAEGKLGTEFYGIVCPKKECESATVLFLR
jgi:hypothetical protein